MPIGNPGATPWFWICKTCGAQVIEGDPHSCPPPEPKDEKKGDGKK